MRESLNVANLFTLFRLLLGPAVMYAILHGRHTLALELFLAAAFTDGIDGALARHFNRITRTGAYLDPVADKVLLSGVYLAMAAAGIMPWWLVAVIFGRDIVILTSAGMALLFTSVRKFPPSVWGKLSTFFQVVTAVTFMVRNVLLDARLETAAAALVWITASITIWSGVHYGWRAWRLARMD